MLMGTPKTRIIERRKRAEIWRAEVEVKRDPNAKAVRYVGEGFTRETALTNMFEAIHAAKRAA